MSIWSFKVSFNNEIALKFILLYNISCNFFRHKTRRNIVRKLHSQWSESSKSKFYVYSIILRENIQESCVWSVGLSDQFSMIHPSFHNRHRRCSTVVVVTVAMQLVRRWSTLRIMGVVHRHCKQTRRGKQAVR